MIPIRGALTLFGSFLLHLTLGTGYTFGNMSPYITSYIRYLGDDSKISVHDVVWVYAMIFVGQGLFMSIGGIIDNKIGPRITTYIGCFLASTGVAVSYFTIKSSLTLLALTYGLLFGIGIGTAYVPPLSAGMTWFPEHKGLVNGIIVAGFGLGSFIFTQVQTFYINSDNDMPNEEGYFTNFNLLGRVPNTFLLLGGIYSIFQLIGCTLLTRPTEKNVEKSPIIDPQIKSESDVDYQYGTLSKSADGKRAKNSSKSFPPVKNQEIGEMIERDFTPMQMLHHRQFYILWATFFLNNQIVFYINAMYKAYGQTFIKDDKYLAMVGAVAAIFNSGGRVIWGWLLDKSTYKKCMLTLTAGVCVFTATLGLTPYGGKVMFAAWIWLIFLFFSGSFVLFPTCTTQTFGMKHAGINYGLVFSNTVIASIMGALLTQNLWTSMGWLGLQGLLAGFSALGFLITLLFNDISIS